MQTNTQHQLTIGRSQNRKSSTARSQQFALLWLAILAMMIIETISFRLDSGDRLTYPAYIILSSIVGVLILPYKFKNIVILQSPALAFYFLYVVWCFASAYWTTVDGMQTLLHSIPLLLPLLIGIGFADIPPKHSVACVLVVAAVILPAGWLLAIIAPSIGALPDIVWRLNGLFIHSQRLALFGSAVLMLGYIAWSRKDLPACRGALWWSFFAFVAITVLATKTRAFTTFSILVLGFLVLLRTKGLVRFAIASVTLLFSSMSYFAADWIESLYIRDGSNIQTLTGRTVIWENSWEMIGLRPLTGYGFASFNTSLTDHFFSSGYIAPHAHNTWIMAAFETGYVGTGLLSAFLIFALFESCSLRRSGGRLRVTYAFPLVLYSILCGLTGLIFGGKMSTLGAIVILLLAQQNLGARHQTKHSVRL